MDGEPQLGWFDKHVKGEADKDVMKLSGRIGELVGVVIALLFAWYFLDLYGSGSDFFSDDFEELDTALFFGIAFLGVIPGLMKVILGRKNVTRPLDIVLSVAMLIAAAWFLATFPFDFAYLSEGLPESLQFLLDWIDDDVAKVFMALAIIVNIFVVPYTILLYIGVRERLVSSGGG